jgi:hypothetical protein
MKQVSGSIGGDPLHRKGAPTMIEHIGRLSDGLLRRLVPGVVAQAACHEDPYDYWSSYCYCSGGWAYWSLCHVYSNCTVSCHCAARYIGCA